ncbi:MAG: UvrD-helicase domain-containing protein [Ectothiorhodospiraceae bacterium AqS1]|nr:UvrD-helicase domain-containing protein [Ectothiorhodospiraceae bacterium AqS1]
MIDIKPRPLAGLLLNPFGRHARGLGYRDHHLSIRGRNAGVVHIERLAKAPVVEGWGFLRRLVVTLNDGTTFILKGVRRDEAVSFAWSLKTGWIDFNTARFEARREAIDEVVRTVDEFSNPTRYPSACLVAPILVQAKDLSSNLLSNLPLGILSADIQSRARKIREFAENAQGMRDEAISRYEARQIPKWRDFFDVFENNPLTPEQRISIVADEDATLVLAGAGSGKTSVITAKAGYLIEAGIRKSEEVLLLAYAKDAAKEMSDRIEEKCGNPLKAKTFHSLAYEIIGEVEGSKPALALHASDDKAFMALIRDILRELMQTTPDISRAIIDWFSYARLEEKSEWDFKTKHDYYLYVERMDLRTLKNDKVKSFEELMIANWLYTNGIAYEYEPLYEHKVSTQGHRDYCPDFRLTKSGVYIEHFGVRREMDKDGGYRLTTASYVDREKYLEQMEWKREIHSRHQTTLIETFSYQNQEERLLKALADSVMQYETIAPIPQETLFDRVVELNQVDSFVQLIGTFLRHYKGGGYRIRDCREKARALNLGNRARAFLAIFEPLYVEYQKRLEDRIDFEDMIIRAAEYVESGKYSSPFKHILVDEFQDISQGRGRLVKALKARHPDARIFAVGDDWQSIYRFAGSDINLMREFASEFGGIFDERTGIHRVVDLGRTFRSVDRIAHAARKFVLQNPAQLKKTVKPAGIAKAPALRVVSIFHRDTEGKLEQVIRSLADESDRQKKTSVLLLGRYRYLAPSALPRWKREHSHLDIGFKTIHSSKGLEADHVIVLNLSRGRTGFPSEIVDDPLLAMVSPEAEPFENAEERRVMYVALTRARHTVTLMASAMMQSVFIKELIEDPEYGVVSDMQQSIIPICSDCGGSMLPFPTKDGRIWYRCEHVYLCGFSVNPCSNCLRALPVKDDKTGMMVCSCDARYPACPECESGWLVEREGRYGRFLGCVNYPRCKGKGRISTIIDREDKIVRDREKIDMGVVRGRGVD